jgi:hypothetical protein
MNEQATTPSRFKLGRVLLWSAVVGLCIVAYIGLPGVWQAFQEHQNRTKVEENLKSIGDALDNYEKKLKQNQVDQAVPVDDSKPSK